MYGSDYVLYQSLSVSRYSHLVLKNCIISKYIKLRLPYKIKIMFLNKIKFLFYQEQFFR